MPRPKGEAPLTRFREARWRFAHGDPAAKEEMYLAIRDAVAACAKSGRLNQEMAEQLLHACPLWYKPYLMPNGKVSTFDPSGLVKIPPEETAIDYGRRYIAMVRLKKIDDEDPVATVSARLGLERPEWYRRLRKNPDKANFAERRAATARPEHVKELRRNFRPPDPGVAKQRPLFPITP